MTDDVLPTFADVMKHLYWIKKSPTQRIAGVASEVADCVLAILSKASLPTISEESVVRKIVSY